jgi:hypothetical protein
MRQEFTDRIDAILNEKAKRAEEADRAAKSDADRMAMFVADFKALRENVVRPAMLEVSSYLNSKQIRSAIENISEDKEDHYFKGLPVVGTITMTISIGKGGPDGKVFPCVSVGGNRKSGCVAFLWRPLWTADNSGTKIKNEIPLTGVTGDIVQGQILGLFEEAMKHV